MARATEAVPAAPPLSVSERTALGKAARAEAPRASHAEFDPGSRRPDPLKLLEGQAKTRDPELVPIRYGRMLASPFAFFRGGALIMASDLAATPRSGLTVQCCGDAHLSNFGVFASPDRRLVFDLNDFDETLRGPWEWDVKRMAASMLIGARENGDSNKHQDRIVLETVEAYRRAMRSFATMDNLAVWYARAEIEPLLQEYGPQLTPKISRRTDRELAKVRTRDSMSAFSKLARVRGGQPRIVADPPLIVPIDELAQGAERDQIFESLSSRLGSYRESLERDRRQLLEQYSLTDFARKVVGVGSVGTRAWIALLMGRDGRDPLFLQLKEAESSVLERFVGRSELRNHGERVVTGQRLMQAASDIFLGWLRVPAVDGEKARDFYGRQLRDWKGSVTLGQMGPKALRAYGRLCGWTLARAHARTGDRVAIAAYLGPGASFDHAILAFSRAYADQNLRDFQALEGAVASGRIRAETGL